MQNKLSNLYAFGLCRDCLNQVFGLNVTPQDCLYDRKMDYCTKCNDFRHIVVALRFRSRLRIYLHRLIKK